MDKQKVVDQIRLYLEEELAVIEKAVDSAREAATHEENKAENQYDTRALEASYLANAQAKRADEIRQLLLMYKFLPVKDYSKEKAVACPGALIELEYNETRAFYFIAPLGGGLVTRVDGKPVQVITPVSPMGEALMGKKTGDTIEVDTRNGAREYEVLAIL
jgi:transcription elongation GreA/GreB family factor